MFSITTHFCHNISHSTFINSVFIGNSDMDFLQNWKCLAWVSASFILSSGGSRISQAGGANPKISAKFS